MHADFWHERWDLNQIGFHQGHTNHYLQQFWANLNLAEGATVFVPLCGKTQDLLWLRAQGLQVLGVELSPIAARDFFAENGLTPTISQQGAFERWEYDGLSILVGDFFDLQAQDVAHCQAVYDRAALIALPPVMRQAYAEQVERLLRVPMLVITMEYAQSEMAGPPFAVLEPEIRQLYEPTFTVTNLFRAETLRENSGFRQRGLSALAEGVYQLLPSVA